MHLEQYRLSYYMDTTDELITLFSSLKILNNDIILPSFERINEIGDGSCLFRAFSRILYDNPDECYQIRIDILDYLKNIMTNNDLDSDKKLIMDHINSELLSEDIENRNINYYIKKMQNYSMYGGLVEILCFSKKYNKNIIVLTQNTNTIITININNSNINNYIYLCSLDNNKCSHYDSLKIINNCHNINNLEIDTNKLQLSYSKVSTPLIKANINTNFKMEDLINQLETLNSMDKFVTKGATDYNWLVEEKEKIINEINNIYNV